jgi:hypothetical protein
MRWLWTDGEESGETFTAVRPVVGDILQFADDRKWLVQKVLILAMPRELTRNGPIGKLFVARTYFNPKLFEQN